MASKPSAGVVRTIVEQLNATTQKALHAFDREGQAAHDLLRRLVGSLRGMVFRCRLDADRTLEFASMGCRTLTGFDAPDLLGNRVASFGRLIHPDDEARVRAAVQRAGLTREPFEVAYRIRRVDGKELWVRELGCVVFGAGGEAEAVEGMVAAIMADQPSRERDVAAGLAHDLNNVFATIKTTAELVTLDGADPSTSADMADIVAAANRGTALARELGRLRSSHPGAP